MQPKIDKSRHLHPKKRQKTRIKLVDEISQNFQNQVFWGKINCIQCVDKFDCPSSHGYHQPRVQYHFHHLNISMIMEIHYCHQIISLMLLIARALCRVWIIAESRHRQPSLCQMHPYPSLPCFFLIIVIVNIIIDISLPSNSQLPYIKPPKYNMGDIALCHQCDISTFLKNLMVFTMLTTYFLQAYHQG